MVHHLFFPLLTSRYLILRYVNSGFVWRSLVSFFFPPPILIPIPIPPSPPVQATLGRNGRKAEDG